MKIGRGAVLVSAWWFSLGGCSSNSATNAPDCPTADPVFCSGGGQQWCCPSDTTCGASSPLCQQMCPSTLPITCSGGPTGTFCCPSDTQCGANALCELPTSGGTGGSSAVGGSGGSTDSSGGTSAGGGAFGGVMHCSTSAECPSSTPCCMNALSGGICGPVGVYECRCTSGSECSSKACAPAVDSSGNPSGPYVCVPNDGAPYHGCSGFLTSCAPEYCCFTDSNQNQFCSAPCSGDNQCGSATCNTYSNANTTCTGTLGCGPK